MFQSILYGFHFLCRRMFPRLFQFFYRIRSIIHRQSQIPLYLCDICSMYFEAVFRLYVLLNHFVCNPLFGLYASALLAILSRGTLPSPNSTFTLITLSGFCGKALLLSHCHHFCPNQSHPYPDHYKTQEI